ncbi:MAG: GlpM family protein [Dehalobacterium sp.]
MNWVEAVTRFIAGGSLVLIVCFLGKMKNPYISGMAVLFPIVTLVGYYFLSFSVTGQALQKVALVSIYSLPTMLSFLITIYFTIQKVQPWQSLLLGILSWLITAAVLILLDKYFLHIMFK